jgi:flavorubredoxin
VDYIRQRLEDPHTLTRLNPTPARDISQQIVAAPAQRTFGSGEPSVQIMDVGPTLHSEDMLVAYVPSAKLFFAGDLVFSNSRGDASPSSREVADLIRRRGFVVDALVTVHGPNTTWAALDAATRR